MTWYDDAGNPPPHEPSLAEAKKVTSQFRHRVTDPGDRARCNICHRWPKLTKGGAFVHHTYAWPHSQEGQPCPGSGSQVRPLPGQLELGQSDQGDTSQ